MKIQGSEWVQSSFNSSIWETTVPKHLLPRPLRQLCEFDTFSKTFVRACFVVGDTLLTKYRLQLFLDLYVPTSPTGRAATLIWVGENKTEDKEDVRKNTT